MTGPRNRENQQTLRPEEPDYWTKGELVAALNDACEQRDRAVAALRKIADTTEPLYGIGSEADYAQDVLQELGLAAVPVEEEDKTP